MTRSRVEERQPIRHIQGIELAKFRARAIEGNRSLAWRCVWYLVNALFFQSAILGLLPSSTKAALLRLFGASVGRGLVCKPRVSIKYPWLLSVGDYVWIGEGVWIDNVGRVDVGSNVCLSQGVVILTGNHNWQHLDFPYFSDPVTIGDSVWVTAFRVIRPGSRIPPNSVVVGDVSRADTRDDSV